MQRTKEEEEEEPEGGSHYYVVSVATGQIPLAQNEILSSLGCFCLFAKHKRKVDEQPQQSGTKPEPGSAADSNISNINGALIFNNSVYFDMLCIQNDSTKCNFEAENKCNILTFLIMWHPHTMSQHLKCSIFTLPTECLFVAAFFLYEWLKISQLLKLVQIWYQKCSRFMMYHPHKAQTQDGLNIFFLQQTQNNNSGEVSHPVFNLQVQNRPNPACIVQVKKCRPPWVKNITKDIHFLK